jgi:Fe-Mn family superoxide dismutase
MKSITTGPDDKQFGACATDRRNLLKAAAGLTASLVSTASLAAGQSADSTDGLHLHVNAFDETHKLKPLPFDAAKLEGLSARLIESHWSNNYGGSVRALNETNKRLSVALADTNIPAYTYNDLKREHLMRTGSVILHELYFDNLGGDGPASADCRQSISASFGDFDRWETEYRRIAAGLSGGSGWVVLGYNRQFGALENYWMADHMHSPPATVPILVMDMYEHSYQMDFGAATARYIDAFFANINWDTVASRIEDIR